MPNAWLDVQRELLGPATEWPQHYRTAFWSKPDYKNRLLVTSFAFNNGVPVDRLEAILRVTWSRLDWQIQIRKVKELYHWFKENPEVWNRYYSWDCIEKRVTYLDGTLKLSGDRHR